MTKSERIAALEAAIQRLEARIQVLEARPVFPVTNIEQPRINEIRWPGFRPDSTGYYWYPQEFYTVC